METIIHFFKDTSLLSLFNILTTVFEALLIFYFLQTFFENSKFSWKTTIIIIFVGSMFVIIVTQIFEASSIVLFLFLFFCTFLFENRLRDKFGIVLLFFLVVLMSGIIVNGVGNVYSLLTQSSIQKEIKQQIFDVYLSDLTVFFCLFFIRNRKMKPISFIGMILVMLVLYISNSFVVFVISVVFGESNQDYLIISLNVTVLSLLLSIAFLFYYVEIRKKNIETQIESKYLKHVYQLKQNEVTAIKESNEEIYKVKHDMKNQLLMIRHLYEKSAVEGNTYIGKLISNMEYDKGGKKYTGQLIIDYFLNQLDTSCKELNIRLIVDVVKLPKLRIDDVDLTIIVSNIFDNAIEASKFLDSPYIDVKIQTRNTYLVFSCINNYSKESLKSKKSNKTEKHGIGLTNVRRAIEKYNGELDIKKEVNIYKISFFIKF